MFFIFDGWIAMFFIFDGWIAMFFIFDGWIAMFFIFDGWIARTQASTSHLSAGCVNSLKRRSMESTD